MKTDLSLENRDGFAMATTLLVVLVLSVLAIAAVWLANSEKRTSFAESVHISSVFSADAGGEAGINFLRLRERPPMIIDFTDMTVHTQGTTPIQGSQNYEYRCRFVAKRPKPGWGIEFLDYDYQVVSTGTASQDGQSGVALIASRLFREGY
jgi:hypothetical protein